MGTSDGNRGAGELGRRQFLGRAGAAAGAAWLVPMVTSLPAGAAQQAGTPLPCANIYALRLTRRANNFLFDPVDSWPDPDLRYRGSPREVRLGLCAEISAWRAQYPDAVLSDPPDSKLPEVLSAQDELPWSILLPAGKLPSGADNCRLLIGIARAEQRCCAGYVDPSPPDPSQAGRRIIFEQCAPRPYAQIYSLQLIYCCP